MSAKRRLERASDDRRPVVTDDFIYDDPAQSRSGSEAESPYSDTPEEAIRKLKGSSSRDTRPDTNDFSVSEEERPAESDDDSGCA